MGIRVSSVSKPFIIISIILLFIGSSLGALLMMNLFGFNLRLGFDIMTLHKIIQIDGFLTFIIMGIGYMLIPRFRNIDAPSKYYIYSTLSLMLCSLSLSLISLVFMIDMIYSRLFMLFAITIFGYYVFKIIRIRPKLLPIADYFVILSIISLLSTNIMRLFDQSSTLQRIEMSLTFPLFMIFAVEYKTLPSFIGYINPNIFYTKISLIFAFLSITMGLTSLYLYELAIPFSITLLTTVIAFDKSVYATHGFNYKSIMDRLNGLDEELTRYRFILLYIRLSYIFLYSSLLVSILYHVYHYFALYDLSIHLLTIGFIGITIKLYLPMMLPPIIGRSIKFVRFNMIPLYLILTSLVLRIVGVFMLETKDNLLLIIGASGWLLVIALLLYLRMVHKSMDVKI
ncbi:MAG: NnrS family protein [Candidatus Nitrosocaldaceae archaeon]